MRQHEPIGDLVDVLVQLDGDTIEQDGHHILMHDIETGEEIWLAPREKEYDYAY